MRWGVPAALAGIALLWLACADTEVTHGGLGAACKLDRDCRTGLICVADDPGGQCTMFCSNDGQCGPGALCDPEGKCYQACNQTVTCPRALTDPRYGCVGTAPRTFCDALDSDGGVTD